MGILGSIVLSALASQAPGFFPDTPQNHWAFEGLSYLKSVGLMVGYPDGLGRFPQGGRGRYEFAVAFNAAAYTLRERETGLRQISDQVAIDPPGSEQAKEDLAEARQAVEELRNPLLPKALTYLDRARIEFAREIKAIGVSDADFKVPIAQLRWAVNLQIPAPGSALKQFPDVPSAHWAAKDVLELRSRGLIHGYPDGAFSG